MLRETFQFLEGIKKGTEASIKKQGISSWNDFLEAENIKGISKKRKAYYDRQLKQAKKELFRYNSAYFYKLLPVSEHWRLYECFKDEVLFLDIETSGVERDSYITVVGMYDGINTKLLVKGANMDLKLAQQEINSYKLLVTFNGSSFDLPVLRRHGVKIAVPHLDLRHACKQAGLNNGLKSIEKQLGIRRDKLIANMYGGDAVLLWRKYIATGDEDFIKLLVEYNEEDIINLKTIAEHITRKLNRKL